MEYRYIENKLKLADAKEIFGAISHMLSSGYIDSFGVVKGVSKNPAYLPIYTIQCKPFIEIFGNKFINFDDMYDLYKSIKNKSSIEYGISDGIVLSVKNTALDIEVSMLPPMEGTYVEFDEYNKNPHLFKTDGEIHNVDLEVFKSSIINDYIYEDTPYVITREAVPKPKKLTGIHYSVSDTVEITLNSKSVVVQAVDSCVYFTTSLYYPLFDIKVANGCYFIG